MTINLSTLLLLFTCVSHPLKGNFSSSLVGHYYHISLSTSLSILMIERLLSRSCPILFLSSFFIRFSFEKDLSPMQFDTIRDKNIRRAIYMLGKV